jgi:serine/threonine-protein kinase HipA
MLAALAGITVAATQVLKLSGLHAVAIRRFDRLLGGGRIHSVSAGTAIRTATATGQEPQMGYPELARLLRRAGVGLLAGPTCKTPGSCLGAWFSIF